MERFVIEQFEGTNRNAVEGVTNAPEAVKNLVPSRAGGLIPLGGQEANWLNASAVVIGSATLVAYDEVSLALLSGPTAWVNNASVPLTGASFTTGEGQLSLAPRSAILAPWSRQGTDYIGGAWFLRANDGTFTIGEGAFSVAFSAVTNASGVITNGTVLSFVWVIEAPTDNGLVVHSVGTDTYTASANLSSLTLTLNQAAAVGTIARFYVSNAAESTYQRFSVQVSDGSTAMAGVLDDTNWPPGTWSPTTEALVNYGPGRLEAHNSRIWGRAGETLFVPFLDSSVVKRTGGYMYLSGAGWSGATEGPVGAVAQADMGLVGPSDYVEIVIERLYVRRTSTTQDAYVELFSNIQTATPARAMWGLLRWPAGGSLPVLEVFYTAAADRKHPALTRVIDNANFALGTALNSSLTIENLTFLFQIDATTSRVSGLVTEVDARYSFVGNNFSQAESGIISGYFDAATSLDSRNVSTAITGSAGVTGLVGAYYDSGIPTPVAFGWSTEANKSKLVDSDSKSYDKAVGYGISATTLNARGYEFRVGWRFSSDNSVNRFIQTLEYNFKATQSTSSELPAMTVEVRGYMGTQLVFTSEIVPTAGTGETSGSLTIEETLSSIFLVAKASGDVTVNYGPVQFIVQEMRPVGYRTSSAADWGFYTTAAATDLAIGDIPSGFLPAPGAANYRTVRFTSIETGDSGGVLVSTSMDDYVTDGNTSWTGSTGETWTVGNAEYMVIVYSQESVDTAVDPVVNPNLTLVFSDIGSVNRGKVTNFVTFSPLTSRTITALASTPAGLLVFMENETFLLRGDPASNDLSVQRLSGTMGCDPGVIPARLGSVVMPIYKGEIYAINLGGGDVDFGGSLVNISKPVWKPDDPFVQVAGENVRNHIVARTQSNKVFRLDTETQQWIVDAFDGEAIDYLLPACMCTYWGTRYNVDGDLLVVSGDVVDAPELEWDALDAGDKNLMKLWRRVELFTDGVDTTAPTLTYTVRGEVRTTTGVEKGRGRWVFTLARGVVGETIGLKFSFSGATTALVVEPPVVIEYVPRYRER